MIAEVYAFLTVSGSLPLSKSEILLRLLSVLLLISINAFFVTAEFSMVSVRRSRINQLVEAGDAQAKTVQDLQRNIDRLLSTTQIGITLSSLALGWIGERALADLLAVWIVYDLPLPAKINQAIAHSIAIPVAFFLIAYLQIVLGELCPKALALLYSEQVAKFLAPPSLVIARFFNPFIWILNQSTRCLLRLFGVNYTGQLTTRITPKELQMMIATDRESSGLEAEERELLNNVFEFGEVIAAEVMVPRTSIVSLPITATFKDLLKEIATTGYSRYPIVGDSLDDIRGIIYFKELAEPLAKDELVLSTLVLPWMRPLRFVPEGTPLSELLPLMQREHQAMVMVVDEFGSTVGLVSLKDVIAQLIGYEPESENTQDLALQILDGHTFVVQAQMNLEEVNELLELNLPLKDEYQTLGGFLLYQFQKIPSPGETLHYDNLDLTIVSATGQRLHHIRIHRREPVAVTEMLDNADSVDDEKKF